MPSNELKDLRNLLTTFQVAALGQGDTNIGINILASMVGSPTDGLRVWAMPELRRSVA